MPHKDPPLGSQPSKALRSRAAEGAESGAVSKIAVISDASATQTMAECFVEEFLRLGVAPEEILELFRQPAYAAAHHAYQALGEEAIRDLIATYRKIWLPVRIIDNPEAASPDSVSNEEGSFKV